VEILGASLAALAFPIKERVITECNAEKQKGKVKHRRKINRTFAYWSAKTAQTVPHELQGRVTLKL
jgi:hypothetical protein